MAQDNKDNEALTQPYSGQAAVVTSPQASIHYYNTQQMSTSYQFSFQTNSTQNQIQSVHPDKFFHQPFNDPNIYHIEYKKISTQLLNNSTQLKEHEYIFYYQQQGDDQIYQISCEIASPTWLNKNFYGIEIEQNVEQPFKFDQKENLKFHLTQHLSRYLLN